MPLISLDGSISSGLVATTARHSSGTTKSLQSDPTLSHNTETINLLWKLSHYAIFTYHHTYLLFLSQLVRHNRPEIIADLS